jgi:1,4-dihydroxy-2-naphthoyl-CoA hydrolase
MTYEHRFYVGMGSVDAAGLMFYPELLRHAHDAYEGLMRSLGLDIGTLLAQGHCLLPIRRAEADYLQPMRLGQAFAARVRVSRIGTTSVTVETEFVHGDGRVCARASTVQVCVHAKAMRPTPLPDALRNILQAYRATCGD